MRALLILACLAMPACSLINAATGSATGSSGSSPFSIVERFDPGLSAEVVAVTKDGRIAALGQGQLRMFDRVGPNDYTPLPMIAIAGRPLHAMFVNMDGQE